MAHEHDEAAEVEWPVKRILTELCDPQRRREIVAVFWKQGDEQTRRIAAARLATTLHFREETIRKAPAEKKADWLLTRLSAHEFEDAFQMALMLYHTGKRKDLLGAFLDAWNIPHEDGSIEVDDYDVPTQEEVRAAVKQLGDRFSIADIRLYLASLGLLMGEEWRKAAWPVVSEL